MVAAVGDDAAAGQAGHEISHAVEIGQDSHDNWHRRRSPDAQAANVGAVAVVDRYIIVSQGERRQSQHCQANQGDNAPCEAMHGDQCSARASFGWVATK